jgi:mannose-6-phosphate isomerase-like protein (cupin superfamily)
MKTSLKTLVSTALLASLLGGLPSAAKAFDFVPLGEGTLPSGNLVENFQFTIFPGETVPWHYHPGRIYGVIVSGTLTEEKGCGRPAEAISAGSAFFEAPRAIHRVFNYGTVPVLINFTFIVPPSYAHYTGTIYVTGPRCEDEHEKPDRE